MLVVVLVAVAVGSEVFFVVGTIFVVSSQRAVGLGEGDSVGAPVAEMGASVEGTHKLHDSLQASKEETPLEFANLALHRFSAIRATHRQFL